MADQCDSRSRSSGVSWVRRVCCSVLQAGHVPRHIAIIMDGNRRFARKMRQEKSFGHVLGFDKLIEVKRLYNLYIFVLFTSIESYSRIVLGRGVVYKFPRFFIRRSQYRQEHKQTQSLNK